MISVKEFHRPKLGNSDDEYEDAFACNFKNRRFAIADGASDSIFSSIWANALVKAFSDSTLPFSRESAFLRNIIYMARKTWYNNIEWDSLKLFVKNKALKGSFSTFLGVQIDPSGLNYHYRAIAVGDSCLFLRNNDDITGFPINDPSKFNITPKLIWSGYGSPFPEDYNTKLPEIKYYEGKIKPGEQMLMATDAISKWVLENSPKSFDRLCKMDDPYRFITGMLEARELRNDDVTFSAITLEM